MHPVAGGVGTDLDPISKGGGKSDGANYEMTLIILSISPDPIRGWDHGRKHLSCRVSPSLLWVRFRALSKHGVCRVSQRQHLAKTQLTT